MTHLHSIQECFHVEVGSAAGGVLPLVPGVTGQRVGVYRMILTVPSTVTVQLQDTSGGGLSQPFAFGSAGGSITLDTPINGDPWWQSAANLGIQLFASAPVQVSADVWYLQGP